MSHAHVALVDIPLHTGAFGRVRAIAESPPATAAADVRGTDP